MFNLIKMDLYRLVHSKVFKVGLIAAAIISLVSTLLTLALIEMFKFAAKEDPTLLMGMETIFPTVRWLQPEGVDYADVIMYLTNMFSLFVASMMSASFVSAEQGCGYFKNIAGQFAHRSYTVISKYVVTCLIQAMVIIIYLVINLVLTPLLFSSLITSYSIGILVGELFLRLLIYCSINAVILFLCILAKSQSFGMVLGAILGIGVTQLLYFGFNGILGLLKIENFDISHYLPDGVNNLLNVATIGEVYIPGIIASIIFIAIFLTSTIMVVKKRDVK